jgi:hypothetical protein
MTLRKCSSDSSRITFIGTRTCVKRRMCGEIVVSDSQRTWRQADWVVQCERIRTEETYSRTLVGRDSSVGTATGYGLDGPEIESRWK